MPLAGLTEGAPRCDRDRSLFQNPLAQGRAVDLGLEAREDVEGSVRMVRRETVDFRDLLEDQVAARPKLLHHGLERGRRAAECRDAGLLRKRGCTGDRVLLNLGDLLEERRRGDEPSQPPAGHRIGLRKAVHGHRAIKHAVQRCRRDVFALVQDLLVDLIAHEDQVVIRREVGQGLRLCPRIHGAGGIRG